MSTDRNRIKATEMLLLANAFWGLSFPVMKALMLAQEAQLPGRTNWFWSALCVVYRFGSAALILMALTGPSLRTMTRLEFQQGLGLGLFGGFGILIQMDGLKYTAASTSAFLTQCYCVLIPIWLALRHRRLPPLSIGISCLLVVAGVGVLAGVDLRSLTQMGRGEIETILSSVLFMGQILWLERPAYAHNRVRHFSFVMFVTMSLSCLPVALATTHAPSDWLKAYAAWPQLVFLVFLVVFCTLGSFLLMNRWQRHVGATLAGVIYCTEPVFASAYALFLPALFASWTGITYANERITLSLLIGGGLITAANGIAQWAAPPAEGPSAVPLPGVAHPEDT